MRHVVPTAEEILDKPVACLDHGFVTLVDYLGSDQRIVEAARLSVAGQGVRLVSEDRALIRYLMRHRHTTPLEKVRFELHVKCPIFVMRQWIRHRMSSTNEMSGRYSVLPEEFYVPDLEHVQFQAERNKQGRSTKQVDETTASHICERMGALARNEFLSYKELLGEAATDGYGMGLGSKDLVHLKEHGGLARELARINLPLSTYTAFYWTVDLHNLFHFLELRLDSHAQYEIRVYAEAMAQMVKAVCPLAYEAFEDYALYAVTFSKQELEVLRVMLNASKVPSSSIAQAAELGGQFKTKREAEEFKAKLAALLS